MINKFYKVAQEGGTYVVAVFFNPITREVKSQCVRDYDYSDGSRDNDELYYMEIDEPAKKEYLHFLGRVCVGDTVEVYKGRKVPVGTIARVENIQNWKDSYGRVQTVYAVLDNGMRTNIDNCRLYQES